MKKLITLALLISLTSQISPANLIVEKTNKKPTQAKLEKQIRLKQENKVKKEQKNMLKLEKKRAKQEKKLKLKQEKKENKKSESFTDKPKKSPGKRFVIGIWGTIGALFIAPIIIYLPFSVFYRH